ncbi:sperm flagellar protein 2-like isoform X1 [Octopus sinensis]|uniref:Sperm flagellar protein 2-like isoform X1 n=1 Tax=Octopus sinensis TaxID=2607531 RepID=A0A7E6FDQ7_9MOLL|nr:sperm flagellar protein 2-like isoform X1 [Octopus sinensis]
MTAILCNWLNNELKLSKTIDIINFSSVFSNGYLIGETLSKYKQQDDLDQFSLQNTIEGRLNNFTRLEPSLHKLGLQFDTNTARDIMTEKHGAATNLMYELFVVLNGKTWKSRPAVQDNNQMSVTQSRLSHIENRIYNEHMNLLIPRNLTQSPTNTSKYFREKQIEKEKIAFKERFLAEEHIKMETKKQQEILHEQSRQLRLQQSEALAKLKTSDNYIYKRLVHPPALPVSNIFLKRKQLEIQEAMNDINQFDKKLESAAVSLDIDTKDIIKFSGDTYIADITKRLAEDRLSREDLEKRRRKVLVSQQQAQDLIWLAYRDKVLVNRILRQSQQEKKIVVQLLQTRQQKNIIMKNRMFQERQYQDRREKDFLDALNKEAELLRLAKEEYADQVLKDIRFHEKVKAEYKAEKYRIHYEICFEILLQILDIVCKICDYRAISSSLLPQKLMREWRALFIKGKPLYAKSEIKDVTESQEENLRIEEAKQVLLDEEDFKDYKNTEHDWLLEPDKPKPRHNPVVGHIVNRLLTLLYPPPPPPEIPVFPEFSIRVCLLGKAYSGKTFCAEKLAEEYNLKILNIDELVKNAIQTFHDNEEAASKANKPFRFLIKSASCIDKLEGKNELVSISRSKTIMPSEITLPPPIEIPKKVKEVTSSSKIELLASTLKLDDAAILRNIYVNTQASLGSKVIMHFEKGQPIPEIVLIEIITEAIRCVKEETGWILDGFPVTYCQTRTLEKALTGIGDDDDDEERRTKDFEKMQNVSQLLPNPHLDVPPAKKVSGIDVVILHNISDDLCLQRAAGQYISEKSKEHFHMLHNPPTFGQATGIAEREKVIPLISKSFDEENAQNRLMIFSNYWPKMEKWFSSLGNLHVVDASQDRDVVYEDIKSIIDEFLQRKKEEMFTAMAADENNVEEQPQIPAETENVANETQNTEENGKKHSAENLPKPEEEPEEKAPEPIEPDSPDWEFVDFEINMIMVKLLSSFWKLIERSYLQNCKKMFRAIRKERDCIKPYYYSIRKIFEEYLKRPDNKQDFVSQWQKEYNEVPDDMRFDLETQTELHQTVWISRINCGIFVMNKNNRLRMNAIPSSLMAGTRISCPNCVTVI